MVEYRRHVVGGSLLRAVPVGELDVELPPVRGGLLFEGVPSSLPVDLDGLLKIGWLDSLGECGLAQWPPG